MKRRIVIKVRMPCEKCKSKAMEIAVKANGVTKVEIQGADKDQLVVTGDGIDAVKLTRSLRKGLRYATLLSVQEEKEKKDIPKQEKKEEVPTPILCSSIGYCQCPAHYHLVVCEQNPSSCFIL